jgi:hypothetical protein
MNYVNLMRVSMTIFVIIRAIAVATKADAAAEWSGNSGLHSIRILIRRQCSCLRESQSCCFHLRSIKLLIALKRAGTQSFILCSLESSTQTWQ